ncbi:alpha/beta fold hydrolase [Motilimonas sp. 1_MG-2023]|uniref:alpha/beta fold hydrolase n=1 Tax=Motilimonas TaxID=1914248 RepID=UPI0026E1731C|nr:alpha/beta hydrolase [Motilimonas sp. 1_MG-2023]MDO6527199.1 alpha/beta hydrolase [Motilimonas sp. 1_MG-2023]
MTSKPTLVLLRGLSRDQRHWGSFKVLLQQSLPHYQVTCLDTLGNGTLLDHKSPLKMDEYGQYLLAQLAEHEIKQPILVGLSLGGMVALSALAQKPEQIHHVITINSSSNLSPWWQRFSLPWALGHLLFAKRKPHCSRLEYGILQFTSVQQNQNIALLQQWSEYRKEANTKLSNSLRQIIAAATFTVDERLKSVGKVSIVSAMQDRLVNPACSRQLAQHLAAPLFRIENAGHDLALDQPQRLIQTIIQALNNPATTRP